MLGAQPLKSETSQHASAGVALTPIPPLDITVDYYHIDITNAIATPSLWRLRPCVTYSALETVGAEVAELVLVDSIAEPLSVWRAPSMETGGDTPTNEALTILAVTQQAQWGDRIADNINRYRPATWQMHRWAAPRAGATLKTLERILAFVPRKIVNVSCNPSTLARDLKLFHLFGFRLDRLRPVDMFPWTYHIECVAEMVREE